jgi:hypothetical protein
MGLLEKQLPLKTAEKKGGSDSEPSKPGPPQMPAVNVNN